jgi:hypothetical protein
MANFYTVSNVPIISLVKFSDQDRHLSYSFSIPQTVYGRLTNMDILHGHTRHLDRVEASCPFFQQKVPFPQWLFKKK